MVKEHVFGACAQPRDRPLDRCGLRTRDHLRRGRRGTRRRCRRSPAAAQRAPRAGHDSKFGEARRIAGRRCRRDRRRHGGARAGSRAAVGARLCGAVGAHAQARAGASRRRSRRDRGRARRDRSGRRARGPRLRPHGDPPLSGGARDRCHASRRHTAARPPDSSGGCRNRACVRRRPVGGDALLPLLLPAERAHAVDARALHAGGLRPRDGARGRRRSGRSAGNRRRGALHHESGPEIGRVRRGGRRRVAWARRRAGVDGPARRLRQGARAAAPRGPGAAQQPQHAQVHGGLRLRRRTTTRTIRTRCASCSSSPDRGASPRGRSAVR